MAGFAIRAYRFRFRALEPVFFPAGKSGNIVRGALGTIFRRLACKPECTDARDCPQRAVCPYARLFEPTALDAGPSGFADLPRPFVFRAAHLDGRTVTPGSVFHFDVYVFYRDEFALVYLAACFGRLAEEGLGPGRGKVRLTGVDQLTPDGRAVTVHNGDAFLAGRAPEPMFFSLDASPERITRASVRFLTPTELKQGGEVAARPDFSILFARVRDRVGNLSALYGDGPLAIDHRAMGDRARAVRLVRSQLEHVAVERHSSKTGQQHPLGGFIGMADYEGELTEFFPYLKLAEWTGVGRQTVWGKGVIEVRAGAAG